LQEIENNDMKISKIVSITLSLGVNILAKDKDLNVGLSQRVELMPALVMRWQLHITATSRRLQFLNKWLGSIM